MGKRKKCWSKLIEEAGLTFRLYERQPRGPLYYSVNVEGKKAQKGLKHRDRALAEEHVRQVARALAKDLLAGRRGDVTLGECFSLYFRYRAPLLRPAWRQAAETRRELFETAWGRDKLVTDLGETDVEIYVARRRSGDLAPEHHRKTKAVRDGTIASDLSWLSSVFNWARKRKEEGKRLIPENPLHDVTRPSEKNVRRPVASHDRFLATLSYTDEVDPLGRLRCALSLARYTGHRESGILGLRASDFLRDPKAIRAALAALGMNEEEAKYMPRGALLWRAEEDKQGVNWITPLSTRARSAIDDYLAASPRVGKAPLLPSDKDPSKPLRRDVAARWLLQAERFASLPKMLGGVWHPYRRLWATERKHLPDADVAQAGGWTGTQALRLAYQHADPVTKLRVVEAGG